MGTPHKHAELIKAWADGAEIQCRHTHKEDWFTLQLSCNSEVAPTFTPKYEYRIKPKTLKYRNYLWKDPWNNNQYYIGIAREENKKYPTNFIKWLGDWQEVEV